MPIPIAGNQPGNPNDALLMQLYMGANGGGSAPDLSTLGSPPNLSPYSTGQLPPTAEMPPLPPRWVPCPDPALSKKPSELHQDEANKYIKAWMKNSAEYVERKVPLWNLLEDLYWNRRRLNEWNEQYIRPELLSANRAGRRRTRTKDWRSQFVLACSPFCDNYTQSMHQRVFAAKDYFTIDVRPKNGPSIEDPDFPTARKMQRKLIDSSNELQFQSRTHETLADAVMLGTQVSKTIWEEKVITDWEVNVTDPNPQTRYRQTKRTIRQGTKIKVVNLAEFLPDPYATNGDVQDWSGVGDRTIVPYELLKARFEKGGPYNLGKTEFYENWFARGDEISSEDAPEIKTDKAAYEQPAPDGIATHLKVWEFHGEVHFSDRATPTECVGTVITGLRAKDPTEGVLVRLRESPALRLGRRPYLLYQFTSTAGPFGIGLIEQNLDLIWYLSHCINLFIDVVRFTSIPTIKALSSAAFLSNRDDEGNIIWTPGMVLECTSNINEIENFALQAPQLASLITLIQYLERMLEKRTAVSDATRGVGETRKTATESHILQVQSQQPIAEKLNLFAETYLVPYAEIALSNFAQYVREDQQIWVRGVNGVPEQRILTVAEISAGQYAVHAALDVEDSAKISKAQTAIQFLQTLEAQEMPMLINESIKISRKPIMDSICQNLDVADPDLVFEQVDQQQQQQLIQEKQPPAPSPPPPVPSESMAFKDLPVAAKIQMLAQVGINVTPLDFFGMGLGLPGAETTVPTSSEPWMSGQSPPSGMNLARFPGMTAPGSQGGPVGPDQNSLNEMFGRMQQNAQVASPVQMGMRGPA